jgi:cell division protein FtsI (penicillin-binding protein 3)
VLAYLHVPQDVEPQNARQWLTLRAASEKRDEDVAEGTPDRLSWSAEAMPESQPVATANASRLTIPPPEHAEVEVASASVASLPVAQAPVTSTPPKLSAQGTVVLDAEGGILVPSFIGRRLREVVEAAQQAGVEIDVTGTGIAREQAPPAGSRIPAGTRVAVRFSR